MMPHASDARVRVFTGGIDCSFDPPNKHERPLRVGQPSAGLLEPRTRDRTGQSAVCVCVCVCAQASRARRRAAILIRCSDYYIMMCYSKDCRFIMIALRCSGCWSTTAALPLVKRGARPSALIRSRRRLAIKEVAIVHLTTVVCRAASECVTVTADTLTFETRARSMQAQCLVICVPVGDAS
jgi:hypothetical protein